MGMSRCYALMKCLLILFNIIFLVVGVGACAFCGWALWAGYGGAGAGRAGLWCVSAWGAALALGAAGCLRGACGSCAALRGVLALLALACAAEAAAAAWGAAHAPQLRQALRDRLRDTVAHEYGLLPDRTHMLDAIQHGLQCCGVEGLRDWQDSAWAGGENGAGGESGVVRAGSALDLSVSAPALYYWVPASCCATEDAYECEAARRVRVGGEGAEAGGVGGGALHSAGCGARAVRALAAAAHAPLCAAAALLAAHVLALLLALALALRPKPHTAYKA